jgi:hypothetical protein
MNQKLKNSINSNLDNLDAEVYSSISEKLKFKDGRELVIIMIYQRLKDIPSWDFGNALSDTELTLKGFKDE